MGVARLHNVVYVLCNLRPLQLFDATTHHWLTEVGIPGLIAPRDIAACEQTHRLYIADNWQCIFRVAGDGSDQQYWGLPRSEQEFITWSAVLGLAKVKTRVYYVIRSTGAYQGQNKSLLRGPQYWGLPRSEQEFITWSVVLGLTKVRTRVYYVVRSTWACQGQDKSLLCDPQYWGLPRSEQEFITWSAVLGLAKVKTRVYYVVYSTGAYQSQNKSLLCGPQYWGLPRSRQEFIM